MDKQACGMAVLAAAGLTASAMAVPPIDSAKVNMRIFNDIPGSAGSSNNNYPTKIDITDGEMNTTTGFANLHNWRFSADGGASNAQFQNSDKFSFYADVTLAGNAHGEGGLLLSPWWSENVDGRFMLNTGSGEVACFGGRLPFYSFTGAQGVRYTRGDTVRLGIEYDPHSLTAGDPGQIRYWYGALNSGWINFDQGNPAEDPPHGLWGILNPAGAGGYFQVPRFDAGPGQSLTATWENISFVPAPGAMGVLAAAGLIAGRRRRA